MASRLHNFVRLVVVAGFLSLGGRGLADEADDHALFEERVRPLLVARCLECHGPDKQESGLRLDARETFRAGGANGPIVNDDPEARSDERLGEHLLLQVVSYDGDIKMPPAGKLDDDQIETLREWVRRGAPWPDEPTPEDLARRQAWKNHWAFQPVVAPRVPGFSDAAWAKKMPPAKTGDKKSKTTRPPMGLDGPSSNGFVITPIDAFVLSKLGERELQPSPSADKATLLRRLKHDLLGLPATRQEIDEFLADSSPDAWRKRIDQYLASPQYGERWGRRWLDLARYADSNGQVFGQDGQLPYAWTYRDWVVRSLNEDLPYDKFLLQQIAGDLQEPSDDTIDNRHLAALGFFTVARDRNDSEDMRIADWLDVLGRTTMGLTLSCARCHDHKYDPIPTRDYYSLYGVFGGVGKEDVALVADVRDQQRAQRYAERLNELEGPVSNFLENRRRRVIRDVEDRFAEYWKAARPGVEGALAAGDQPGQLNPQMLDRLRARLNEQSDEFHPIYGPWRELTKLSPEEFKERVGELSSQFAALPPTEEETEPKEYAEGEEESNEEQPNEEQPPRRLNARVAALFQTPPESMDELQTRYVALFAEAIEAYKPAREKQWNEGAEPQPLENRSLDRVRGDLYVDGGPMALTPEEIRASYPDYLPDEEEELVRQFLARIAEFKRSAQAHPHAVVFKDPDEPYQPAVFKRGNPDDRGDEIPRRFLGFLSPERQPFENGTGRLELARSIVDPRNPLTARVIVNRVWGWRFGRGLVDTPSDFGVRCDGPSHPELLDWLTDWFVRSGWSLKKLHRLILLSNTWKQSSADRPDVRAIDPGNRLLWRANRVRLDFESLHDGLLAVSGRLDEKLGGPPEPLFAEGSRRRAIYGVVDRANTMGPHSIFDFPSAVLHSPTRDESLVPQQALFLLNGRFAAGAARAIVADELARLKRTTPAERKVAVGKLFVAVLARQPDADEAAWCEEWLSAAEKSPPTKHEPSDQTWWSGQAKWDAVEKRLTDFKPFAFFTGDQWRPGSRLPHGKLGYMFLNNEGGHPPQDAATLVVRRWIAPEAGVVDVTGELSHSGEGVPEDDNDSDGVRGRLLVRGKMIGSWGAFRDAKETKVDRVKVAAGDAIDFAVDCRKNDGYDNFRWPAKITFKPVGARGDDAIRLWDSQQDFSGPRFEEDEPLTPWERLAQTLLMSNEFLYVD